MSDGVGGSADASRSYESITRDDLSRLARIARLDREDFFARKPRYLTLAGRLICVALCQGAALHLIDGTNGVKDFDVWTFFAAHPGDPRSPGAAARRRSSATRGSAARRISRASWPVASICSAGRSTREMRRPRMPSCPGTSPKAQRRRPARSRRKPSCCWSRLTGWEPSCGPRWSRRTPMSADAPRASDALNRVRASFEKQGLMRLWAPR